MNNNFRNNQSRLGGSDGKFTNLKRWLVGLSGIGVLYVSIIFSKEGMQIQGQYAWMGFVIAIALSCAEFMFNSNFESLNWTIFVVGIAAYAYSIWTNITGFYVNRQMVGTLFTQFDLTNLFGGIFLDVYPEVAIAWALKESKIGDLIGNAIKTARKPGTMTDGKQEAAGISGKGGNHPSSQTFQQTRNVRTVKPVSTYSPQKPSSATRFEPASQQRFQPRPSGQAGTRRFVELSDSGLEDYLRSVANDDGEVADE
jgi:hypothetical protein